MILDTTLPWNVRLVNGSSLDYDGYLHQAFNFSTSSYQAEKRILGPIKKGFDVIVHGVLDRSVSSVKGKFWSSLSSSVNSFQARKGIIKLYRYCNARLEILSRGYTSSINRIAGFRCMRHQ